MSCDLNWNNVVLLLECDGTNGQTTFTDISPIGNVVTAGTGGTGALPFVSTTTPKFGTGCATFNVGGTGTGGSGRGVLYTPVVMGGALDLTSISSWTVEEWVYVPSTGNTGFTQILLTYGSGPLTNGGTANGITLEMDGFGNIGVKFHGTSSISIPGAAYTADAWNHVAIVNNAGNVSFYMNGVATTTPQSLTGVSQYVGYITFGGNFNFTISNFANSYRDQLDEIRITSGVARYTSNFTPTSVAFPVIPCGTTVPNVSGLPLGTAYTNITNLGFVVGTVTTSCSDTIPTGYVISTSPPGGSTTSAGSVVNIFVSDGLCSPTVFVYGKFAPAKAYPPTLLIDAKGIEPQIYMPKENVTVQT